MIQNSMRLWAKFSAITETLQEQRYTWRKALNTSPQLASHVHALIGKVYGETNRTPQAIAQLKFALPDDKVDRSTTRLAAYT